MNSFPLSNAVSAWRDLEDGSVLWRILVNVDADYFHGDLPEMDRGSKENWIPRWQNLKYIDRQVTTYIREECDKLHYLSPKLNPDLKSIATEGSAESIVKLVRSVLLAAMYSSKSNERMIRVMQSLGPKVAMPIAHAIEDVEDLDQKLADQGEVYELEPEPEAVEEAIDLRRSQSLTRDPELEYEERLISAMQEKRKLEAQVADLSDELTQMRDKFGSMEDELQEAKFTLDRRRRRTMDVEELQKLTLNANRDKDYITELETDLAAATATIEQNERHLEKLRADEAAKQELRDELQVIRAERDELRQKSKANDNLKKKIQTMQEQEKVNLALRNDLAAANERIQDLSSLKDRCTALEKINEENVQAIANGEQEIFDQKTAKKRLEHEVHVLASRLEQSREQLSNTQDRNRELEDQIHELETSTGVSAAPQDLDAELNDEEKTTNGEVERPKSKSAQGPTISADSLVLQQNLSLATASVSRLEQRCLDLLQENLGYKAIIDDKEFATAESQAFQHQTRRLEEALQELEVANSKFIAATTEITDLQHRLERTDDDKNDDAVLVENQERQKYTSQLEAELHDQKALLRHALLSNAAMQKEDDGVRQSNEYRLVCEQLEVVHSAPDSEAEDVIAATAYNLVHKIEESRIAASQSGLQLNVLNEEIDKLKVDLEAEKQKTIEASREEKVDAKARQEMLMLQRENKLIASAWYDLTTRLQSNTVLLSRRAEAPRTMIGRARAAVHSGPSGGSSLVRVFLPRARWQDR